MKNTNQFLLSEEEKLNILEQDKEYCLRSYEFMRNHISVCLKSGDYAGLLTLCPYFDTPENFPQFHPSGEVRKIQIMLNFLQLELKFHKTPFVSSTTDFQAFINQYTQTVFALRRLELALNETAMEDAISYLAALPLNIYMLKIITENECFENYGRLYRNIYYCLGDAWPITDKILWLQFLLEYDPADSILLELASLYLDAQDLQSAYDILLKITAPTSDTLELLSLLEENLHVKPE